MVFHLKFNMHHFFTFFFYSSLSILYTLSGEKTRGKVTNFRR